MLKHFGHHVRIFERSPSSHLQHQGAGRVFGSEAQEFFGNWTDIGRLLTVTSKVRQTPGRDGKPVTVEWRKEVMVSWDLLYFVLRAAFDGENSECCEIATRRQGDGIVCYEDGPRIVGI